MVSANSPCPSVSVSELYLLEALIVSNAALDAVVPFVSRWIIVGVSKADVKSSTLLAAGTINRLLDILIELNRDLSCPAPQAQPALSAS